jgi:hypothetical protein
MAVAIDNHGVVPVCLDLYFWLYRQSLNKNFRPKSTGRAATVVLWPPDALAWQGEKYVD